MAAATSSWATTEPENAAPISDEPRWAAFQAAVPAMVAALPPGLVSVEDNPGDSSVVERALAALSRDGAVVLGHAVSEAVCDGLMAELAPYLAAHGASSFESQPDAEHNGSAQVRRMPSWPRSWANFRLLWLYSY
jgi:hypothetical protein